MKPHEMLRAARDFITSENGVVAPLAFSEEVLNPAPQDDLSLQAVPLESISQCYQVDYAFPEESSVSEFSYFEDGRQQTVQIGFIPAVFGTTTVLVPIHFFVVSAVILRREDRQLKLWRAPKIRTGVLVEKSLVPDQHALSGFESAGLQIVNVPALGGDYYDLKRRALQEAKNLRLQVENDLITEWRNSLDTADGFLVVDGTLMNFRNERNVERCVGISKSFGNRYFSISDHNRIMAMRDFERSWVFQFHPVDADAEDLRTGGRERVSWYLRLRTRPNVDPEFGLVRVEISRMLSGRATEYADRFSRSLLSERLPTAYPSPRWDNQLYPIQACENYLSSVMPSVDTINAAMKG